METKPLRIKTALRTVLVILMMGVVGITKGYAQGSAPTGAINGRFSVSVGQKVYFSQGNLQYQASTNTWRFAENQCDIIGSENSNISENYSGWIDLFGWGTSGYHDANDPYNVNYQPWSTSSSQVNSSYNYYGYGPSINMSDPNLTGTSANYDWGVYNPISNGGNTVNQWRTLTQPEWDYIFNTRITVSGIRYAKAKVNNINGVILLPDDWSSTIFNLSNTNTFDASFSSNTITASQWNILEQAGAVFLPAAGYRGGASVSDVGSFGSYWSASYYDSSYAYIVYFYDSFLSSNGSGRYIGQSVRLVCPAENYSYGINAVPSPAEGGTVSGGGTYTEGADCTLTATPSAGWGFMNWTENGEVVSTDATYTFTVTGDRNLVANFTQNGGGVPTGAINGKFSVSEDSQVYFSQGNLQYQASTDIWKFAENQCDIIGSENSNISENYVGWIDLFGWGTSGYHDANDPYNVNYQPWSTSTSVVSYSYNYNGYGPSTNMTDPNLTGTSANYDWGVFNPINNGGNQTNQWRTLTKAEWQYVFNTRTTTSGIRFAKANVNNVNGVILLPDDWSTNTYSLSKTNTYSASFSSNTITASQWNILEQAGAVFLPAAGYRGGASVSGVGSDGDYWSASYHDSDGAYDVYFAGSYLGTDYHSNRFYGRSVRLVCPAENYSYGINAVPSPAEGVTVSGGGTYEQGAECTLTATANEGYTFTNWTENGEVVSTEVTYTFTVTGDRTLVANFTQNGGGGGDHAYVDLGLPSGLLWATCNVGADTPEDYGDYFAWGETQPKDTYNWSTYQYCMGSSSTLTKYCNNSSNGYNGFTDNLTILLPEDDAATANWGTDWRMPTEEEFEELYNNTTVTWTTQNGVNGRLFTASNGNSLFLPAAGHRLGGSLDIAGISGNYWSSSLYSYPIYAWNFYFYSDDYLVGGSDRYYGQSVRPVRSGQNITSYVIDVTSSPADGGTVTGGGTYEQGAECTLTATANEGYTFTNWTENDEVVSTEATYTFTVTGNRTLVANFTQNGGGVPTGAINGKFTVKNNGYQVYFSQGNLQYQASTDTWKFAENQCDIIGSENSNISENYVGWIDLFGWGTSGYHDANDPYNVNYQPWSTSTSAVNSSYNYNGYGPSTNMTDPNLTGTSANYDWGVFNPISNGGNQTNQWRTLTIPEWDYIFNTRTTVSGIRYAKAKVNNVNGVILLPDDWISSTYSLSKTNTYSASFSSNTITASQWNILEQAGAVFLPAAGYRGGASVNDVGSDGYYWSASYNNSPIAYGVYFNDSYLYADYYINYRCYGQSVRLVCPAENYSFGINAVPSPAEGGEVSGGGTYAEGAECTLTATPSAGWRFMSWTENGEVVSTDATYTFTVTDDRNLVANFIEDYIEFADPVVKSICIANWDTNGNGELSYAEAAAVTSLGTVFKTNSEITSFDELQYFTGLTEIGTYAFRNCTGLLSLTLPESITNIGNYAFYCCTGLSTAVIPDSVTNIGNRVYYNCTGMVSLTIGESVISIGELTFSGCSGLSSITINATEPPTVNANSFNGVDKSIPVYIPCGVVTAYQTANVWNEFTNYQEVGCPEVTQITELSEGWNWFSTYITFDDPVEALQALEASLGNNAEQIQSYYYTAEYDGEEWFGDLNAKGIVNQQMYLIYAVNDCTVELTGIPAVVDEYEIVIKPGWNWIGFPNGEAISVEDAMSDFEAEEEDQIQSIDYIAEFDGDEWFGDLGTFVPGQGYMYLSKSDTVKYLVFKTGTKKRRGK